jgi:hypothetical protein
MKVLYKRLLLLILQAIMIILLLLYCSCASSYKGSYRDKPFRERLDAENDGHYPR